MGLVPRCSAAYSDRLRAVDACRSVLLAGVEDCLAPGPPPGPRFTPLPPSSPCLCHHALLPLAPTRLPVPPAPHPTPPPAQLGMTPLADLTHSEYRARALGFSADLARPRPLRAAPFPYHDTVPPKQIDWTKKGAVTEVGALRWRRGVGCARQGEGGRSTPGGGRGVWTSS